MRLRNSGAIVGKSKSYKKNAVWIAQIETENTQTNRQEWSQITFEETKTAIQKTSNWKAPGIDGITKFLNQELTILTPRSDKCL